MDDLSLKELCQYLSISEATGKNWVRLHKLIPTSDYDGKPFFSRTYCEELKASLQSGENTALKSRRNKKYVSGAFLYRDYVSPDSPNVRTVETILNELSSDKIGLSDDHLRGLLAECALELLNQHNQCNASSQTYLLHAFLENRFSVARYDSLIADLLDGCDFDAVKEFSISPLFGHAYTYEASEDILGLLYLSCRNLTTRKATGAYYTPTRVVKTLIESLQGNEAITSHARILDPCCGTGNFLLQLPCTSIDGIFGMDLDEISVQLTRINMALKFPSCDVDTLRSHFIVQDYLTFVGNRYDVKATLSDCPTSYGTTACTYDVILGNPPWGAEYTDEEKKKLRSAFKAAKGKSVESYDLFIEQSLRKLNKQGTLAFVLPEAVLHVKSHETVRRLILQKNSIPYINYLGDVFDRVQCPSIILQVKHTGRPLNTIGMRVVIDDSRTTPNSFPSKVLDITGTKPVAANFFTIKTSREITAERFSFNMQDEEYFIIQKLDHLRDCFYLRDHADFALGLVTGNNKKYITDTLLPGYEPVLKGTDIYKYKKVPHKNFIHFSPDKFQQVALVKYYRAPEKLLYRFISNQLVFAYDDLQTLTLNSCNIVIPKLPGVQMKYVLAILNSRIAQFLFAKKFQSVKVLRTHIEQIPIPAADVKKQAVISAYVNKLMSETNPAELLYLYNSLDKLIANLFQLNDTEYKIISVSGKAQNLFLY